MRSILRMRGCYLFIAAVLLMTPMMVQAQTLQVTNVNNDEGDGPFFGGSETSRDQVAQGFTTGDNANGYLLALLRARIKQFPTTPTDLTAQLWSDNGSDRPGSNLVNLSFDSAQIGVRALSPDSSITLSPNTVYHLVFRNNSTGTDIAARARVDARMENEQTGESGWSIKDERSEREENATWASIDWSLKISVLAVRLDDDTGNGDDDDTGSGDDEQQDDDENGDDEPQEEVPALPMAGAAGLAALLAAAGARALRRGRSV